MGEALHLSCLLLKELQEDTCESLIQGNFYVVYNYNFRPIEI